MILATVLTDATLLVANAAAARALFASSFDGADSERAEIAYLDHDRRVIARARVAGDRRDAVVLPVRAIIGRALAVGAPALIIAHNHPGGSSSPSGADLAATRALATAAACLGIKLVDHLVFAAGGCRSFRQAGLL